MTSYPKNPQEKISEFLEKHNYRVAVDSSSKCPKKILASFPERKIKPYCEPFVVEYEISKCVKDKAHIKCVVASLEAELILCPKYSAREIIFYDIYKMCELINYDKQFIKFNIDDKEVDANFFKQYTLILRLSKKDKIKEMAFTEISAESRTGGFSQELEEIAIEKGVEDSYAIIKEIAASVPSDSRGKIIE